MCCCRLAQTARSGCGIQNCAGQLLAPKFALRVTDRFSFGVSVGVVVLDDATWALADQRLVQHEYRSVGLIAPGMGKAPHFGSGVVPAKFWVSANSLGLCRRPSGAGDERHCASDRGSSAAHRILLEMACRFVFHELSVSTYSVKATQNPARHTLCTAILRGRFVDAIVTGSL